MEITWYKDQVTTPPISYNSYYLDVLDSRYTSGYARPDQTEQEAEHRAATGRQRLEVRGAALDGPRPAGPVPVDDDLRLDVPEQPLVWVLVMGGRLIRCRPPSAHAQRYTRFIRCG